MLENEKEIISLVKIIVEQKKLQFHSDEIDFNIQLFENDTILS